jgi:hypothetical protein
MPKSKSQKCIRAPVARAGVRAVSGKIGVASRPTHWGNAIYEDKIIQKLRGSVLDNKEHLKSGTYDNEPEMKKQIEYAIAMAYEVGELILTGQIDANDLTFEKEYMI